MIPPNYSFALFNSIHLLLKRSVSFADQSYSFLTSVNSALLVLLDGQGVVLAKIGLLLTLRWLRKAGDAGQGHICRRADMAVSGVIMVAMLDKR